MNGGTRERGTWNDKSRANVWVCRKLDMYV